MARGNFEWLKGRPIVKYTDTLRSSMQSGLTGRDAVCIVGSDGPRKS